jgi:hypothetical protein
VAPPETVPPPPSEPAAAPPEPEAPPHAAPPAAAPDGSSGLWSAGGPEAPPPPRPPAVAPPRADSPPTPAPVDPPPRDASPPRETTPAADPPRESPPPADASPSTDPPVVTYVPERSSSDHAPPADEPKAAPREPLNERIGRVDPQAGELSELLRERLALPGIVAAGIAGAASGGIVLAAGLLIALITPDASILGTVGQDASIITEAFRQAVGTLLTAMVDPGLLISGSRRIHPMLLLAIPLSALIFTTRWQLHRTEGAPPLARLGWAAVIAVPFGLLMLAFAIIGGKSETTRISPSAGSAFALGLLWGALGGLIGAATKLPLRESIARIPPTVGTAGTATLAALRPLAAVLVTCTAIGLVGWLVQVGADAGGVRNDRSAATALIEEASFAGEDGVHLTALAAGARFRADANGPLGLPFPVADANDVPGNGGAFRIFSYDDALPAYVLLPALVLLMGLVALGALYAGFAAARAVKAGTLGTGAAWGAITGPAWAIAMALLVILAGGIFHGDADDASVFGVFLLGGALLGAAGGALSVSGQASDDGAASSSS